MALGSIWRNMIFIVGHAEGPRRPDIFKVAGAQELCPHHPHQSDVQPNRTVRKTSNSQKLRPRIANMMMMIYSDGVLETQISIKR